MNAPSRLMILWGFLSAASIAGCGGGGGGPTGTGNVPNLAGTWRGTRTTEPHSCPLQGNAHAPVGTSETAFGIAQTGPDLLITYAVFQAIGTVSSSGRITAVDPSPSSVTFNFTGQVTGDRLTGSGIIHGETGPLDAPISCDSRSTFDLTRLP